MLWCNVRRAAWIALFTTLVALGVAKLDLFGLESKSGDYADDVGQRLGIIGHRLPGQPDSPRLGQDAVRVIHIDDEGLAILREEWGGWPPGYENLAFMIQDVATPPGIGRARGVFVDLEITGENLTSASEQEFETLVSTLGRLTAAGSDGAPGWNSAPACHDDALTTLACMLEWGGVPIILASGETKATTPLGPARARLAKVALLSSTLVDARNYPLADASLPPGDRRRPLASDRYNLYPAAALYAVDCLVRARTAGHDVCGVPAIETARRAAMALKADPQSRPARPTWGEVSRSWKFPEAVVWSSDASPLQKKLWQRTSGGDQPSCLNRLPLLERLTKRGPVEGNRQACGYTLSLGYDRIVAGLGLRRDHEYPQLLSDKLLLIGTHFRGNDWVPTPLHGALPGVQYHAMALDNLLESGLKYRRNEGRGLGRGDLFSSTLTFLLFFAVNLAAIERRRIVGAAGPLRPLKSARWYAGLIAIIVVVIVGYIITTASIWHSVVINWIGILGAALSAVWFTARNDISGDLVDPLSRTAAGRRLVKYVTAFVHSLRPISKHHSEDKQ